MKTLLILLVILLSGCVATPFAKLGVRYNLQETEIIWDDGVDKSKSYKVDCFVELGAKIEKIYVLSIQHSSKCAKGSPWNNDPEYSVDGIFAGVEVEF